MYKIKASDLQLIGGCNDVIDKVIANSVIETGDENKTLIRWAEFCKLIPSKL